MPYPTQVDSMGPPSQSPNVPVPYASAANMPILRVPMPSGVKIRSDGGPLVGGVVGSSGGVTDGGLKLVGVLGGDTGADLRLECVDGVPTGWNDWGSPPSIAMKPPRTIPTTAVLRTAYPAVRRRRARCTPARTDPVARGPGARSRWRSPS